MDQDDQRLIEHGFPCHQVGAETQREQSVGLQPPVNRLHVWWARRPLTPSRAAIVASLSPADTDPERFVRQSRLRSCPEFIPEYTKETLDGFIYARQVICPHCEGEVPLLNTFWLSKQAADPWGVRLITDGQARRGRVRFETYRLRDGRGPRGENPGQSTVSRGLGTCPHCAQAIVGDEIKRQARGESPHGRWQDRLYAVVAVRFEPKLDKHGQPQRYKSGAKKGEIKTRKVRFFRPPNQRDLEALAEAQHRLEANWAEWEAAGLIPMKEIPPRSPPR